jgi:cytochrome c553
MKIRAVILGLCALSASILYAANVQSAEQTAKIKHTVETVCASCHGVDGNSMAAANPKLAAQHSRYLFDQLQAFKSGARNNPIMMGMVANLTESDMRGLAHYFSQQKAKQGEATDEELAKQGRDLYRRGNASAKLPACMACHGPDGRGISHQFPRLSGQHASYVFSQLKAFKDANTRKNATMNSVALRMTEQEMKAVSEYISGLR